MGQITEEQREAIFQRDATWVENLSLMSRARVLNSHLSAFHAHRSTGGHRSSESPADQCRTWLRAFCARAAKDPAPFQLPKGTEGRDFPDFMCIANLSGNHQFMFSKENCLAKVLCLGGHHADHSASVGVMSVVEKAREIGASVVICFCLPFQFGIDRAYWELRTIRRSGGALIDGELTFRSTDEFPREVPPTLSVEHCHDVFEEVARKLVETCPPVCLDKLPEDEESASVDKKAASRERLEELIGVLQSERRGLMDAHRRELETLRKKLADQKSSKLDAELAAEARVEKIKEQFKASELEVLKKLDASVSTAGSLQAELCETKKEVLEYKSKFAALELSTEQDRNEAKSREKALGAQNLGLNNELSRKVAEQIKMRAELKKTHEAQVASLNKQIADSESKLRSHKAATRAVQASASEARQEAVRAQKEVEDLSHAMQKAQEEHHREVSALSLALGKSKAYAKCMRATAVLCALRLEKKTGALTEADAKRVSLEASCAELQQQSNELQRKVVMYKREARDAKGATESVANGPESGAQAAGSTKKAEESAEEARALEEKLKVALKRIEELEDETRQADYARRVADAKAEAAERAMKIEAAPYGNNENSARELEKKTHMISELSKRLDSLERMLNSSERENAKLKADLKEATDKLESDGASGANAAAESRNAHMFNGISPQSAFPKEKFIVDSALENTISQLHLALNYITSQARSSSSNAKSAEVAQTKLDALSSVNTTPVAYYEQSVMPVNTMMNTPYYHASMHMS